MIFLPFYPLKIIIANLALGFTSSKHQVGKNKSENVMKCVNDVLDVRFVTLCIIFTFVITDWQCFCPFAHLKQSCLAHLCEQCFKTPSGQFQNITINTIKNNLWFMKWWNGLGDVHTMLVHDLFGQVGKNHEDPRDCSTQKWESSDSRNHKKKSHVCEIPAMTPR